MHLILSGFISLLIQLFLRIIFSIKHFFKKGQNQDKAISSSCLASCYSCSYGPEYGSTCMWGNFVVSVRNCLTSTLDYIVMPMRQTNQGNGYLIERASTLMVMWSSLQDVFDSDVCEKEVARSLVLEVKKVHCKIGNKHFVFPLDAAWFNMAMQVSWSSVQFSYLTNEECITEQSTASSR